MATTKKESRGSKKDKVEELVKDLELIGNQADEQYTEITSKLGNVLAEVSDIKIVTAKEKTLLIIKEILTSSTTEAYRKMNELKDDIALMHTDLEEVKRLSYASLEGLARLLQRLDDPYLQELLQHRPFTPSVIVEREGDKIFFKSTYSNTRNEDPITPNDFEKLDQR